MSFSIQASASRNRHNAECFAIVVLLEPLRFPGVPLATLGSGDRVQKLLQVMDWFTAELRKANRN